MSSAKIPAIIINLPGSTERRETILARFERLWDFEPILVSGCDGGMLPRTACEALAQSAEWASRKGTIGNFLGHVRAWEEIASMAVTHAIVLEDDGLPTRLAELPTLDIPPDAEIVFLNDRMSLANAEAPIRVVPIVQRLQYLDETPARFAMGSDGYLITPAAAAKLLDACRGDLFYGIIDGRLLRYCTSESDLAELAVDSRVATVIRRHHHPVLKPRLGLLKGYCLSYPMIVHRGVESLREIADSGKTLGAG